MKRGGTTVEAYALVAAALAAAIIVLLITFSARAADTITACSAVRGHDGAWWSYREIDRRRCWYRGSPGRAKSLLRWSLSSPRPSSVEAGRPEIEQAPSTDADSDSRADPSADLTARAVANREALWQATMEDQQKAFTCCWPDLATTPVTRSVEASHVIELPRATPPKPNYWPYLYLPVIVVAMWTFLLIKRRLT